MLCLTATAARPTAVRSDTCQTCETQENTVGYEFLQDKFENQVIIEIIYKMILSLVTDNISGDKGQFFFPLVFNLQNN